jgi:hypothetical protein
MKRIILILALFLLIGCGEEEYKKVVSQKVGQPFTAQNEMIVVESNPEWTKWRYWFHSGKIFITVKNDTVVAIWRK